ncbi:thioredoxin [Crocosphaera sp.]|uniref:thioredoxin n=1 Tax=Crocosphaera sp. TaxID=2729996 RepID=UPI003F2579A4|nr:thioredoxin [Crocosphaera sp.]
MTKATFIEDKDFENLLAESETMVVDYTATWCGPCRVISPYIDRLAEEYQGRVKVFKIDLDKNKENAKKYSIKSIPAVLIFKEGKVVEHLVGKATYETFKEAVDKHL